MIASNHEVADQNDTCWFCLQRRSDNQKLTADLTQKIRVLIQHIHNAGAAKEFPKIGNGQHFSVCRRCHAILNTFIFHYQNLKVSKMWTESSLHHLLNAMRVPESTEQQREPETRTENAVEIDAWRTYLIQKCKESMAHAVCMEKLTRDLPSVEINRLPGSGGPEETAISSDEEERSERSVNTEASSKLSSTANDSGKPSSTTAENSPSKNLKAEQSMSEKSLEEFSLYNGASKEPSAFSFIGVKRRRGRLLYFYNCSTCQKDVECPSQHLRKEHMDILRARKFHMTTPRRRNATKSQAPKKKKAHLK